MMLLSLLLAGAQPAQTPRAFLERVYAQYRSPRFSPLEHPERIFSPVLTAAIRRDQRLAKGEVGYLDGDPLCDCQDYQRITLRIDSLRRPTRSTAAASVRVNLGFDQPRRLRLNLVLTKAGWRVADVVGTDGHSLLSELNRANAGH